MNYEMRKLNAKDLFKIANILNKIGIGKLKEVIDIDRVTAMANAKTDVDKNTLASAIGTNVIFDVVGLIVSNLEKVEKDLFVFLADVIGTDVKKVETMDINDFMDLLVAIIKKDEFKDFFKRLSMSSKSE